MQSLRVLYIVTLCLSLTLLSFTHALPVPIKTHLHHSRTGMGADPEENMNMLQILAYWGYPGESHYVITPDGYNLTIHRIPHGKVVNATKGVVYLQHCLLCSSVDFVINLPNESLAFMLADEGYDVWLGNIRGNHYSRKHVTLKPSDAAFWEFSWDEHALIDLPTMIDYVLTYTGQTQLKYAGHSQGTLMGFVGFSSNESLAAKIQVFAAMAPVLYVGHLKGLLVYLAQIIPLEDLIVKLFGIHEFLPSGKLTHSLAELFCEKQDAIICEDVIFSLCGPDQSGLNKSRLSVYVSHTPAGTSIQNMLHWGQAKLNDNLSHFDYGKKKNMEKYHQPNPPAYTPPYNLKVPIALYYGGNDWLVQPEDYQRLVEILPNVVQQKLLGSFEHLDFIWGLQAAKDVYVEIIELFGKY